MDIDIQKISNKVKTLDERITILEKLFNGMAKSNIEANQAPPEKRKPLSLKEFLKNTKLAKDIDITLAIGFFLERHSVLASFTANELGQGFGDAKHPSPKNINDIINKNIQKGYMMKAKEKKNNKGAWVLTSSGEEFIEKCLNEGK